VFLGHFGVGLAAKKYTPYTSLGTLLLSAQLLDLLWPAFLSLGYEQVRIEPGLTPVAPLDFVSYPWSHSLLAAGVWALLFAGIYTVFRRYPRGAVVIAVLVLSHWVLDFVTHRPDLPLWPWGGPKVGLGLWNSRSATLLAEGLVFAVGLWVYGENTEPTDRIGKRAFVLFAIVLGVLYLSSVFGPPPPDVGTLTWAGHAQWLLVLWGYWLDRHRVAIRQW
jgi:membrane-bound metal-dependent hydrolase YbcI (DUF457 family)